MRLTFLGTGTSFGVPQVGCGCAVCRSDDPRDRRSRSGALLESGGSTILLDTPPELRLQLLARGVTDLSAVLYTHEHADHTAGIDDLRIFTVRRRAHLPVYGPPETLAVLTSTYRYIFDPAVTVLRGHLQAPSRAAPPRARRRHGGRRRAGPAAGLPARPPAGATGTASARSPT